MAESNGRCTPGALTGGGHPGAANLRPPWQKGESGNPGGRARGIERQIRERSNDGVTLLDFVFGVMGNRRAALETRLRAAVWLVERGWGKPVQPIGGDAGGGPLRVTVEIVDGRPADAVAAEVAELVDVVVALPLEAGNGDR